MQRPLSTIAGLGLVAILCLALMSMFYLQKLPTKGDMHRLEEDLSREYGFYLSPTSPLKATLSMPHQDKPMGILVTCSLRPDLRARPGFSERMMDRIGRSVLRHPDWKGRVAYVTVRQPGASGTRTLFAGDEATTLPPKAKRRAPPVVVPARSAAAGAAGAAKPKAPAPGH